MLEEETVYKNTFQSQFGANQHSRDTTALHASLVLIGDVLLDQRHLLQPWF